MRYLVLFIFSISILFTCAKKISNPKLCIYTNQGIITAELYLEKSPITVQNFLSYVQNGFYDNALFYRTVHMKNQPDNKIKIEVIQGGLAFNVPNNEQKPIIHENTEQTGIKHLDGTLSMARLDTGTATSEFFICINDQPELDYGGKRNPDGQGFAAFGRVTKGMDVVRSIQQMPDSSQFLIKPVIIDSMRVVGNK